MRTAHIVTTTHGVGDRVLALCGEEHKVKMLWDDIPDDNPLCRQCVDTAIAALDQTDEVITQTRRYWRRINVALTALGEVINPDDLIVDGIADAATLYERNRERKQQDKADRKRAKRTCTCEWTDMETFEVNPDCPIHGGPPPIAPPVAPEE